MTDSEVDPVGREAVGSFVVADALHWRADL